MGRTDTGNAEFERFFRALYPRAYGIALRILASPAEAEDAAAEAFARTLVRWRRVSTLDYRDAWVLRVTANVAVDTARRRRPTVAREEPVEEPQESTADRVSLLGALSTLPSRQRDVLVLRYFGDFSDDDIARCLSMATGTVKSHVHRGLVRLRDRFDTDGREVPVALDASS